MMDKVKLGDCCVKIGSGATPKGGAAVYIDSGTSFIRSQNVYNMHFDFEEWLRFSVSVPDYACCDKNIFKALIKALEHSTVGYGKYQILKEDCRNKGFWKNL